MFLERIKGKGKINMQNAQKECKHCSRDIKKRMKQY